LIRVQCGIIEKLSSMSKFWN